MIVADYLENRLLLVPSDGDESQSQSDDGSTYPIDKGILGAVVATRKSVLTNNVHEHRLYRPGTDPFTDATMSQIMCHPVCDRSQQVLIRGKAVVSVLTNLTVIVDE